MTTYLGVGPEGIGASAQSQVLQQAYTPDSKAPLGILLRVQMWITSEFKNLSTAVLSDSNSEQYLRVVKSSPHPVLVTQPSVHLICRVDTDMHVNCQLHAFNSIVIKQVAASLDEEYEDLKALLTMVNHQQTSICRGIPEEKLVTWASRKNLSHVLIERFMNRVVFRERNCCYVILETDQADICRSCALLLSSSSMDLHGDEELECPEPDCDRTFKYQGALEKHIIKHSENVHPECKKQPKQEQQPAEESLNHIKLEPEVNVNEPQDVSDRDDNANDNENEFLDRLLDDLGECPPQEKRRRKKKKKPPTKDYACCDCGKAFYYQKNLFTHVVEKHGKSVDELPNLALVKSEDGVIRKRKRRGKGDGKGNGNVYCDECGVTFKFASGLYNHRKRMHGDTKKKPCPNCDKLIKSCTMDQHIREEHGTPRYACQFCGKGFYYKSFMLNHQRLHTGDYKECICDLCGAVYKSVQVLNRHVRNAHQDLRNHKCDHCDKAFHNKQRLDRHINSQHTKSKLWPCPVCHSKYDRKDNLRTHIRKNHSGVCNPDTVELIPVDNDGGYDLIHRKHRPTGASHLISQALMLNNDAHQQQQQQQRTPTHPSSEHSAANFHDHSPNSSMQLQERNVHGAEDLLHLKYGEDEEEQQLQQQVQLRTGHHLSQSHAHLQSHAIGEQRIKSDNQLRLTLNAAANGNNQHEQNFSRLAVAHSPTSSAAVSLHHNQQNLHLHQQRGENFLRGVAAASKQERMAAAAVAAAAAAAENNLRLSSGPASPPLRDVVAAVRESAVPMLDVMHAMRDNSGQPTTASTHTLAQTIHHIQNGSYVFPSVQGPPI